MSSQAQNRPLIAVIRDLLSGEHVQKANFLIAEDLLKRERGLSAFDARRLVLAVYREQRESAFPADDELHLIWQGDALSDDEFDAALADLEQQIATRARLSSVMANVRKMPAYLVLELMPAIVFVIIWKARRDLIKHPVKGARFLWHFTRAFYKAARE